jgi:CHAT domain-containing protein/tetratricopeptide (TPR) repeat protein
MIALLAAFPVLALTAQAPQPLDELRALARDGPDSVLVERVRQRPDDAREALRQLLATAGGRGDSAGIAALTATERVAGAFAVAWRDSFFVRQVARFRSLSPAVRQATVAADSVRQAGDEAKGSAGIDAAIRAWRESLRRFEGLGDTAGVAAALGNIGAGFYYAQQYDSAEAYVARSLDLAERIGDHRVAANAVATLRLVSDYRGDLRRASELLARAGELRERTGDARGRAADQNTLGIIAATRGDLAAGRRAFEAALTAMRGAGYAEDAAKVLLNLAHVARIEGDYAEAEAYLREALSTYRARGNRLYTAATLKELGGLAVERGDYPGAVTALSEAAGILRRIGPGPEMNEVDVRVLLAHVRANTGDLQGARTELQRAEALPSRPSGGWASRAGLALERGNLAVKFNRLAEAERQYARAERFTTDDEVRQAARYGMAVILLRRESHQRAEVVLEQLFLRPYLSHHNAARIRLLLGQAASRRGDTATARRAFGQALDTLRALSAVADEAEALGKLGDLEAQAGRALAAESLYQRGLTRLGTRPAPGIAWPLHAGLAGALRRRGALAEAAEELRAGIGQVERASGGLPLPEHRAAFLANKWDVYVELALVERERGRTEAAFEASEQLRARQMLDLLARGRVAEGAAGRGLASREQDLRRRMADLTGQLAAPEREEERGLRDPAAAEAANAAAGDALARAQAAYGELLVEMREANPAYAALVRGEIAPVSAVMAALAPDELLLEYLVGDSTTIVFVVTRDSLAALDLKVSHSALAAQVDFARTTLGSLTAGAVRRAWRPSLRRLNRQLVAPVEASGLLAGKRRIIIAPHAELHYLPFAALLGPGPPEQLLVERYMLEYVPSASVWLRLRERPEPARGGGVLALAPRATALPGSRAEVAAIRRLYGDRARTLVGTPATERAFRTLAPGQEIVHLATFGVLNKHNPLFSYVELGAGGDDDGRLEVQEAFGLTLNARLLVLSACQTGVAAGALADVPPGDDWVGLVQGFLYAGAANVLVTLWPVADVATARLMERFYGELAGGRSEAEALARAQRAAVRDPATAHPFFWAGFTLVRGR